MNHQSLDNYLEELRQRRKTRRWGMKAALTCAVLGGAYGATLGVTIGAVPPAADIIALAAAIFAVLLGLPGARWGFFFSLLNRTRFGHLMFGGLAALAGAILGGFIAAMLLMAFGAILGAIAGSFIARAIAARQRNILTRFATGLSGVILGTFVGVVLWGVRLNRAGALIGLAWGAGIGVVAGLLLLGLFIAMINNVSPVRAAERRDYVDATFRRED